MIYEDTSTEVPPMTDEEINEMQDVLYSLKRRQTLETSWLKTENRDLRAECRRLAP